MNVVLEVNVLPKGDHPEWSEPQLRKGNQPWEGSSERNRRRADALPRRCQTLV